MSAERARPFGPLERRALGLALGCSACFSLDFGGDPPTTERTAPRYIETFCAEKRFELEGDAELTSGITDDQCGFAIGPAAGTVVFVVPREELATYVAYTFEALVANEDATNPRWTQSVGEDMGTTDVGFAVSEKGRKTRIVDVRLVGELPDDVGCSIGRVRRAR